MANIQEKVTEIGLTYNFEGGKKLWDEKGLIYRFEEKTLGFFDYIIQFSPWLLIIFFWFLKNC